MIRSTLGFVVLSLALVGCGTAATPVTSSLPTEAPIPTATTDAATDAPSDGPTAEPTTTAELDPDEVALQEPDVPAGFTIARDDAITIETEVTENGAERGDTLEERGFIGGHIRGFSMSGGSLVSSVLLFAEAEGAMAEFDEIVAVYSSCDDGPDTGGTLGDDSETWVCVADGAGADSASVIFVKDGWVVWTQWRRDGALLDFNQAIVVELSRLLADRLAG